jgi:hypothetical protein
LIIGFQIESKKLPKKMNTFKRIFRICTTKTPLDNSAWYYSNGKIVIKWRKVPELQKPCGAVRLEGQGLTERIILLYGIDGQYHAFRNTYPPLGMRLDPIDNTAKLRSCGILETIFDYSGNVMSGFGKESLKKYRVETRKCKIIIWA